MDKSKKKIITGHLDDIERIVKNMKGFVKYGREDRPLVKNIYDGLLNINEELHKINKELE
jgi:hypothetical protein